MPDYHFDIENDGSRIHSFGTVRLIDDADAVSFGKRVVRELLQNSPEQQALWRLNVFERDRIVARIPVDFEESAKQTNGSGRPFPSMWL